MSFKDKMKAAKDKVKGEVKDLVGKATDDQSLSAEGKYDKTKGEVEKGVGKVKDKFDK